MQRLDGARTDADDRMMPVWQGSCDCAMGWRGFWRCLGQSSFCSEEVAVPSHRCACAGVCAFLRWAWCALNGCPGHQCMHLCTFHRCFWHHHIYLRHNHCRMCTCARVYAVFSLAFGDEGGGIQQMYAEYLLLSVGNFFDRWKDTDVVMCLLYFWC